MKLTKGKTPSTFIPFSIDIETEKEAEALWHILNNTGDLQGYWKNHFTKDEERTAMEQLTRDLWKLVDIAHKATPYH